MVVDPTLATDCMSNYDDIMQNGSLTTIRNAYTQSVTYSASDIKDWLENNNYLNVCDSFRVSFGIYTSEAAAEWGVQEGRLTAFIWPVKSNQEYAPFNVGELNP